jgi:dihydroneopterin aldolase
VADSVRIAGIEVDCVVGVYPEERRRTQPLRLDVLLELDTRAAAESEDIACTVDYEALAAQCAFICRAGRFHLLETAAHVLARYLMLPRPGVPSGPGASPVQAVQVSLTKPWALGGRAVPTVTVSRGPSDAAHIVETRPFGLVQVVQETVEAGIYRLDIEPGCSIPNHVHRVMDEVEMVLGDGLLCQGQSAVRGSVRQWPLDFAHTYHNPTQSTCSVLCVDRPRFREDDEIVVTGQVQPIAPDPHWATWVRDEQDQP